MDATKRFNDLVSMLESVFDGITDTSEGRIFHIGPYKVFISWRSLNARHSS